LTLSKESKRYPVQIKKAHRITIPEPIFTDLKLKIGDFVLIKRLNHGLQFIPAKVIPR